MDESADMGSTVSEARWVDVNALERKALSLFMLETIKPEEYKTFLKLIWSPDRENHVVAEEMLTNIIKDL